MVMYFCPYCGRETEHLNVSEAAECTHVTRKTIYNWLAHSQVHCVHRASGRKFICVRSLVVSDGFGKVPPPDEAPVHTLHVHRPRITHARHP